MSAPRSSLPLPHGLARALDAVRRRWLAVRVAEFPLLLLAVIAFAWVLQATADRWLELSWNARAVLLALNGVAALVLLWFFVLVPLCRRLDRRKAALLVERTLPDFRTSLISAVEFSERGSDFPSGSRPLVEKLLADVSHEAEKGDIARGVVKTRRLKRIATICVAVLLAAAGCFAWGLPLSPLLVQRILLSNAVFPDETKVVDLSGDMIVVAGTDAALSAKADGVVPQSGRLVVTHPDGTVENIPVSPSRTEEGVFQFSVRNVRESFAYRFELHDGVGPEHQVGVRVPPVLRQITFTQVYPKHTGLPETIMSPSALRLLAGSQLKISAEGSEALQSAVLEIKGVPDVLPLEISGDAKTSLKTELKVPESGWKSMSVHLVSAAGEASANDPVYRVELVRDRPPSVLVSQPKKETITVIPGEKVPFVFRVGDDFGLQRVALCYRVFRPTGAGAVESAEEGQIPMQFDPAEKSFSRTFVWDLGLLVPVVPVGGTITCWIEAEDNNPEKAVAITRSAEKIIRVVSEEQKRTELLELLGERAKDIEKLYELQRGMNERTDDSIR
ncbi:MAG: hypothetical protein KF712_19545 [Akkermansiaceae bacterium]|nr:hypothetical protein [Akkermansiaceae bacterium]